MEQYAIVLGSAFKALGHSVVFRSHEVDQKLADELGMLVDPVAVPRFPRKLQDFRYFRAFARYPQQSGSIEVALSRVRSRDLVICGGTHLGYQKRARKLWGPFDLLQTWMEREAYRSARFVISHSDLCRDELIRFYGVPEQKIKVVYPPIESRFRPVADGQERLRTRQELGLPADKTIFLFPSMGHRRKGLEPVARALEAFSDRVVLAVAGKPSNSGRYPFIKSLGFVTDMAPLYRAVDFTILGSSYEPFGLVGPESLLCGTRLVFEENIGCLTALNREHVITFAVSDVNSIRSAIARALEMAQTKRHRLNNTQGALLYDPSPVAHAELLLAASMGT